MFVSLSPQQYGGSKLKDLQAVKKLFVLGFCAMMSIVARAQYVMVVEKNDNTTIEYNVEDIQQVYFKKIGGEMPNPSNSVLSSRLKDINGNPVYLEGVKDENNEWVVRFSYDENGILTGFYVNNLSSLSNAQFTVEGMTYKSTSPYQFSKYTESIMAKVTLNEDGFISKLYLETERRRSDGTLKSRSKGDVLFEYDGDKQLIRLFAGNGFGEEYDDNGNLKETEVEDDTERTYSWINGNIYDVNHEYTEYSTDVTPIRQHILWDVNPLVTAYVPLAMIGLFGVGYKNIPDKITVSLNDNGTVSTEKHPGPKTYTYYYK